MLAFTKICLFFSKIQVFTYNDYGCDYNMNLEFFVSLFLPFVCTTVGAGMVFFLKNEIKPGLKKLLYGFSAGVMIAASVWSLIIPSIEMSEGKYRFSFIPALVGFLLGVVCLILADVFLCRLSMNSEKFNLDNNFMLILAVTIHNVPEGMAVGVALGSALESRSLAVLTSALVLSVGIALQNLPEGAVVSFPLLADGHSKKRAFLIGTLSGIVEPIASAITLLLMTVITSVLPFVLSFAAGAMMYVVVCELIPESQEGECGMSGVIGTTIGFSLMMVLDVALG